MRAVDPILPTEAEVTISTSISPLPDSMKADAFTVGLTFTQGQECATPQTWPHCQEDAEAEKCADSPGADVGFKPFLGYYGYEPCEGGVFHALTEAEKAARARMAFDATKHQVIARQLWFGASNPVAINANGVLLNPSLRDSAAVLGGSVVVSDPIHVIARLVAARQRVAGSGLVLIHGPLDLVPYLVSAGLIRQVGGKYVGPGFTYVTDGAYPNDVAATAGGPTAGPIETGAIVDSDQTYFADVAGEIWLYASGAVEYAWGRYVTKSSIGAQRDNDGRYSEYTTWHARQNKTFILVEQEAFLRFDPCAVYAAKAYVPTVTQGSVPP